MMAERPSILNGNFFSPLKKFGANSKFPLPQANSTPKRKFPKHFEVNGNRSLRSVSPLRLVNGGSPPKRRKTVLMQSDDEDIGVGPAHGGVVNGNVNGHGPALTNGAAYKNGDSYEVLQEHRKQLPIAQGEPVCLQLNCNQFDFTTIRQGCVT